MKSTGMIRRIDTLGRIVIPKSIRKSLGLKDQTATEEGTALEIFVDGEQLIFRKYVPGCICCGEASNLREVKGIMFCPECIRKIAAINNESNKINI